MPEICELCQSDALEPVYAPERSLRGLCVHLCRHCGLVQSLPRVDRVECRTASVSGGADWGNVRYGKGFRTAIALDALRRYVDETLPFSLLDVGSNRGSFVRALGDAMRGAEISAVEPDERVAQSCQGLAELIVARIEDCALETGRFDVVHSCHTLEHLAHPARALADHWRVLKDGGLLILDVPNIAMLGADDIVEEWFIDKHLYHFSMRTLTRMVEAAGFEILEAPDEADRANLFIVARKAERRQATIERDGAEIRQACGLIARYAEARARNLEALKTVADEIRVLAPQGVAMWGAGRIFDSLVVHGGFDPKMLRLLIDAHLKAHVGERYGCALCGPEALADADLGVIVVMSRSFAAEIGARARTLAPRARILHFAELLSRARLRLAA
jgi:2-polyprenyl-3-methyl-5-hydroxy-6-metoxy-1,4-benzoquinol methylase